MSPELIVFNPGYEIQCGCGRVGPGAIIRQRGNPKNFGTLCGLCLASVLTEVTKQDFRSQYLMWDAVKRVGKQAKEEWQR